jgi:hypothetical protein
VSQDTDAIILAAISDLRTDVSKLTLEVGKLRERNAHDEGLERGLALGKRVDQIEHDMGDRPTTKQIGDMLDNRLRKMTNRAILGAFAAAPAWMAAGVAVYSLVR